MPDLTTNYSLKKPLENENYSAGVMRDNMDAVDAALHGLDTGKLSTDGNGSSVTAAFTEAEVRANIGTGETHATIFGKIKKFLTDLKTVAFTGSYNDLDDQPTIPAAPTDATITTTDVTTNNASTTKHGWAPKATAPSSGLRNVMAIDNGETGYKNAALFDATSPSTQAFGDAASVGSAMTAARRDHKHAMPAAPSLVGFGGGYAASTTAVGTVAKTATLTGYTLTVGGVVGVKFNNGNTATNPTLNIASTGAKPIFANGANVGNIPAGYIAYLQYDGTNYNMLNPPVMASGILKGDGSNGVTAAARGTDYSLGFAGTGTIASSASWSGPDGQGYYTYAVTATGVLSTDSVDITRVLNLADSAAAALIQAAWNNINDVVITNNTLTFYAKTRPSVSIPIAWKVVR